MNSLPWWGNVLGEIFVSALHCGALWLLGHWKSEEIPL